MNFINSDIMLTVTVYDDEYEAYIEKHMTVEEILDAYTNEGCPTKVEQPERKKGKWVGYDGDWLKTMCKCSECGAMIDINEKYRNFFCYHCGARMDGEQDALN